MRLLLCGFVVSSAECLHRGRISSQSWPVHWLLTAYGLGVGGRRGVGRGRRVGVGVAVALAVGVAVGVPVGVGDGVPQPCEVKCSFSVWNPTPSTYACSTVHTSQAVIAVAARSLPVRFGLGNTLQPLPSQCPIKVNPPPSPTAQMSFAPVADTSLRKLSPWGLRSNFISAQEMRRSFRSRDHLATGPKRAATSAGRR